MRRHVRDRQLAIGNKNKRTHVAVTPAGRGMSDRVRIAGS
jgi:hypothetical protein